MLVRCVDLETTGLAPPAAVICEIGWTDVTDALDSGAWSVLGSYSSFLIDPQCPIPPETSAVHHIIDDDLVGAAPLEQALADLLDPAVDVLAAHSAKFERQWLTDAVTGGLPFICTYKCALRLWPDSPAHNNQALRYWRRPEGLDRSIASIAHRAGPDAYVTAFHLRDMLALAPIKTLIAWSGEPALQIRCHIGKWRGALWRDVDDGYLEWISKKTDFDEDTLFTVEHERGRRCAERTALGRVRVEERVR